jgi:hypothetical protein
MSGGVGGLERGYRKARQADGSELARASIGGCRGRGD